MGIRKKKMEIGPDTVLQRRNDLLFNEIDGEVVMLSVEKGEYYGMNNVASRIWELLNSPLKLSDLIEILIDEYAVSRQICFEDTLKFLEYLINKNLLILENHK